MGTLRFGGCCRWRWAGANHHEWFKVDGDGGYSGVAPRWGKFYELIGPARNRHAVPRETIGAYTTNSQHILYYFRDEMLELVGEDWSFSPS
ncbi:hypothetical protein [Agrobacterium pusense]|uniref:hypothetical protein n=2 Tax=Rhizobium/Agrobacterium group TaxID=227290 RepID=UPI001CB7856B|nr:hypothetical protein [Agrobacterium pusense]